MLNLTPLARLVLSHQVKNARSWRGDNIRHVQLRQLDMLTRKGERTGYGKANKLKHTADYAAYALQLRELHRVYLPGKSLKTRTNEAARRMGISVDEWRRIAR